MSYGPQTCDGANRPQNTSRSWNLHTSISNSLKIYGSWNERQEHKSRDSSSLHKTTAPRVQALSVESIHIWGSVKSRLALPILLAAKGCFRLTEVRMGPGMKPAGVGRHCLLLESLHSFYTRRWILLVSAVVYCVSPRGYSLKSEAFWALEVSQNTTLKWRMK